MVKWLTVLSAASLVCLSGCGGEEFEIAEGPLSGKIGGQEWTFVSGWTDDFLSDQDGFFTVLYDTEAEACGFPPDVNRSVLLDVPTAPGEYKLSFSQNVTLNIDNDNNVATIGRMVVESVTDTEVDVGLYAIFGDDENFEVSGHFTATICPSTQ